MRLVGTLVTDKDFSTTQEGTDVYYFKVRNMIKFLQTKYRGTVIDSLATKQPDGSYITNFYLDDEGDAA